jgi:glycosyltransferase involved in cell wall biosynthesis
VGAPDVSIILPVYNTGLYLERCLKSIINQSFTNWELIAIDDASVDNSLEILRSISDPRVRVFHNEINRGVSFSRNLAISTARGQFIALQDADDYMDSERLSHQIQLFKGKPELDLVGTYMTLIDNAGNIVSVQTSIQEDFSVKRLLFRSDAPAHATLVGRKSWFSRNPYPEYLTRAEDRYMIVNAVYKNDFRYALLREPLYFYRYSNSQSSQKLSLAYRIERLHLIKFLNRIHLKVPYFIYSSLKTILNKTHIIRLLKKLFNGQSRM